MIGRRHFRRCRSLIMKGNILLHVWQLLTNERVESRSAIPSSLKYINRITMKISVKIKITLSWKKFSKYYRKKLPLLKALLSALAGSLCLNFLKLWSCVPCETGEFINPWYCGHSVGAHSLLFLKKRDRILLKIDAAS